jgi:UDP:flavonoid glycosyltransferase YjiC (YdhE family)
MRIKLLIAGSRGDAQPAIALGLGLKKAGYQVCLVSFKEFGQLSTRNGLDFVPLSVNMADLYAKFGRLKMFESGAMILRFIPETIKLFRDTLEGITRDYLEASQGGDLLIGCPANTWLGYAIGEKLGIPYIDSYVLPLAPTRSFPTVLWPWVTSPGRGKGLVGILNLSTTWLVGSLTWLGIRPLVNRCRKNVLGMAPAALFGNRGRPDHLNVPALAGFSELILPRPMDWGEHIHVTGYWFLDTPTYEPPEDLKAFLRVGPPPVYIGFGSMPSKNPAETAALIVKALRLSGQRGILCTGKGILGQGMVGEGSTNDVFFLESIPHDWLFPRMAAVVHHGGSGTTAAGLRAGVPSVLVPVAADQRLWAQRVGELGLGPKPIPRSKLTPQRLSEAIQQAIGDQGILGRASAMGKKIRAEEGVSNAVRIIKRLWA